MFKTTDNLKTLVDAANNGMEWQRLVYKACDAVDMQLGDNVHQLPNMIKKLVKRIGNFENRLQRLEENTQELESIGWLNRGG